MSLAIVTWVVVCSIAVLLSVIAHRGPDFFLVNGILSKPFGLWILSMIVLDIGVILVGMIAGYNPPFTACAIFLLIQVLYIPGGALFYIKSKVQGDQFNVTNAKKRLRSTPMAAIFLTTWLLAGSFGLQPGDVMTFLPPFAMAGLMWLLEELFIRLIA